jgi:hypothetical protein
MRYLVAAPLGFLLGALLGIAAGGGHAFISFHRDASAEPSAKATVLAMGISQAMNCGAFLAIAGVPTAIGIAYLRRKKR